MRAIGTIAYVTKGLYDPSVTYKEMDVVLYSGSLWEPKKETTGNAPPETQKDENGNVASNEYWKLFLPGALGDDYVKKTDLAVAPTDTDAGKAGIVIPDGKTILVDADGTIHGASMDYTGTFAGLKAGIASGEIPDGTIAYVKALGQENEKAETGSETPEKEPGINMVGRVEEGVFVPYASLGTESAPVYIFTTKEGFDSAITSGDIPDGALIVKTYDAAEAAGGPFDPKLSKESENAVQNKVVSAELEKKANGPGITFSIEDGVLYATFDDGTEGEYMENGNLATGGGNG